MMPANQTIIITAKVKKRSFAPTAGSACCVTRMNWLLKDQTTVVKALFSNLPDDVGLYGKPMGRNVQLWNTKGELVLDGPRAKFSDVQKTQRVVQAGGTYFYRFLFPAMTVGKYEVYWQRPLVAYRDQKSGVAKVLAQGRWATSPLTMPGNSSSISRSPSGHACCVEPYPRRLWSFKPKAWLSTASECPQCAATLRCEYALG